jgi:hypothetical protein
MTGKSRLPLLFLALAFGVPAAAAAQPADRPPTEPPTARVVVEVPTPESELGFRIADEGRIASWAQLSDHMHRLGAASEMVRIEEIGSSVLGRPMLLAVITSPRNMRRLDEIRRDQARVADPRGVPDAELARFVREQPTI